MGETPVEITREIEQSRAELGTNLRELEQVPLTTPEARDGYFFHESLERLFSLVNEGWEPLQAQLVPQQDRVGDFLERGFTLRGLHSTLFSPHSTPRLSRVKLRNTLVGEWGFRRLTLIVDDRALIPRPETETVVERCLELLCDADAPLVLVPRVTAFDR